MMTRLKAPADTVNVSVAGREYEIDNDGYVRAAEADVPALKRMGFREIADMQIAELRASVPDLETATVDQLTAWLLEQGVEIPPWREILVANVRRVVALKEANIPIDGGLVDPDRIEPAEPEAPAPTEPPAATPEPAAGGDQAPADATAAADPREMPWPDLKALATSMNIAMTSTTSRADLVDAVLAKRVELLNAGA